MLQNGNQLETFPGLSASALPLPPLFRWPGGKRWLVPQLLPLIPERVGSYHEPFFGGGALYFASRPLTARISDANAELMTCYRAVRDEPEKVARALQGMVGDAQTYYSVRASRPRDEIRLAARTIFLATHAFNGIYRVNQRGEFNVPYGHRRYADLGNSDRIIRYSNALKTAEIEAGDFARVLEFARPGDFVYLDPPYTVAHENNGFLKYNDKIFEWEDQERLAQVAIELDAGGCAVVISNAYHSSIAALYPGFRHHIVGRHSVMAANAGRRGGIREYIFTNI